MTDRRPDTYRWVAESTGGHPAKGTRILTGTYLPSQETITRGKRKDRTAHRQVRSRREIETQLLREGVEMNPGPRARGSRARSHQPEPTTPAAVPSGGVPVAAAASAAAPAPRGPRAPRPPKLTTPAAVPSGGVPVTVAASVAAPAPLMEPSEPRRLPRFRSIEEEPLSRREGRVKREPAKRRAYGSQAVNLLRQEITNTLQAEAGAQDAAEEQRDEALEAKLQAEVDESLSAAHRAVERVYEDLRSLDGISFHPLNGEPYIKHIYVVASAACRMPPMPQPHRVATVRLLEVRLATTKKVSGGKIVTDQEGLMTAQTAQAARAPGWYHILEFEVTIQSYGFAMQPANSEIVRVSFSLEQLCAARASRIASSVFYDTYVAASRYRALHRNYPCDDLLLSTNSLLSDQVFAAYLMEDRDSLNNDLPLLIELGYKQFYRKTFARTVRAAGDAPMAGGYYVRGYHTEFADIFPDRWRELVDEVRAGRPIEQAVDGALADVSAAGAAVAATGRPEQDRGWRYCRMLPGYIKGVIPAFPNPMDKWNQLVGMTKRLCAKVSKPSAEGLAREAAIAEVLAERMRPRDYEPDAVYRRAVDACKKKNRTPEETEAFVRGVLAVEHAVGEGTEERLVDRVAPHLERMAAFIKPESYPGDKVKALRYIICPDMEVRGILFAVYSDALETYFEGIEGHNVKKQTQTEFMARGYEEMAAHSGDFTAILNGDFTSYESQIFPERRLQNEGPVLKAAQPMALRKISDLVNRAMARDLTIVGPLFFAYLVEAIRRSGEQNTSGGNNIQTVSICFARISEACEVPFERVKEWFRQWDRPWMVEGDDSSFLIPQDLADKITAAFKKANCQVKTEFTRWWADSGFCGTALVDCVKEGRTYSCLYADPIEKLASMTSALKCDPDSNRGDLSLQVAKAMSYLISYPNMPILAPYCRKILNYNRELVGPIVEYSEMLDFDRNLRFDQGLADQLKAPTMRYIRDTFLQKHGDSYHQSTLRRDLEAVNYRAPSGWIPDEMRARVAQMRPALGPNEQLAIEFSLMDHARMLSATDEDGVVPPVDIPLLREECERGEGVRRMLVQKFVDLRLKARARVDEAVVFTAAKKAMVEGTVVAAKGWISSRALMFWALSVGIVVAGWSMLIAAPYWMVPAAAVGSLVMTALAWVFMITLFGLSFRAARGVTTVVWWGLLFVVAGATYAKWTDLRAAAARIRAEREDPAAPEEQVPPPPWTSPLARAQYEARSLGTSLQANSRQAVRAAVAWAFMPGWARS